MRKQYIVRLTEAERETLRSMVKKGRDAAYKIRHANVRRWTPMALPSKTSKPPKPMAVTPEQSA